MRRTSDDEAISAANVVRHVSSSSALSLSTNERNLNLTSSSSPVSTRFSSALPEDSRPCSLPFLHSSSAGVGAVELLLAQYPPIHPYYLAYQPYNPDLHHHHSSLRLLLLQRHRRFINCVFPCRLTLLRMFFLGVSRP